MSITIRRFARHSLDRAGRRAAFDLAREVGVRRRAVRRIIRDHGFVRGWADVRRDIEHAAGRER